MPTMLTDSTPGNAARRDSTSRWNRCARSGGYFMSRGRNRISATCEASKCVPASIRWALAVSNAVTATSATATAACTPRSHESVDQRAVAVRVWK